MLDKLQDILRKLKLSPGSGGYIVQIGDGKYELPYESALRFANAVHLELHMSVKVYSKATPGAVYLDLKGWVRCHRGVSNLLSHLNKGYMVFVATEKSLGLI